MSSSGKTKKVRLPGLAYSESLRREGLKDKIDRQMRPIQDELLNKPAAGLPDVFGTIFTPVDSPVKEEDKNNSKRPLYKSRVFSLDDPTDLSLFNELINNPDYSIVFKESTWTKDGQYRMFVVYASLAKKDTEDKETEEEDPVVSSGNFRAMPLEDEEPDFEQNSLVEENDDE
jgi:hypothetical protein